MRCKHCGWRWITAILRKRPGTIPSFRSFRPSRNFRRWSTARNLLSRKAISPQLAARNDSAQSSHQQGYRSGLWNRVGMRPEIQAAWPATIVDAGKLNGEALTGAYPDVLIKAALHTLQQNLNRAIGQRRSSATLEQV